MENERESETTMKTNAAAARVPRSVLQTKPLLPPLQYKCLQFSLGLFFWNSEKMISSQRWRLWIPTEAGTFWKTTKNLKRKIFTLTSNSDPNVSIVFYTSDTDTVVSSDTDINPISSFLLQHATGCRCRGDNVPICDMSHKENVKKSAQVSDRSG